MANFPLDSKFEELRQIVDLLLNEMTLLADKVRDLTQSSNSASQSLKSIKAPSGGGSSGGGSSAGGSSTRNTAANEANLRLTQAREAERVSRQFVENASRVREAVRSTATLAKRIGLPQLEKQADKLANALEAGEAAIKATVGSAKLLGASFLPGAIAVGVAVAAVIGLQKAFQSLTGVTLGVKDTITVFAAGAQKAFLLAKRGALELAYAMSGGSESIHSQLKAVDADLLKVNGAISAIGKKAAEKSPVASQGLFKDIQNSLGELGDEARKVLEQVLAFYDETFTTVQATKDIKIELTPFENFKANMLETADLVQGTFDFIESGVQQLSATISSAIVDAFTQPQSDIKASFGKLFAALAKQLLQLLIQALVVKAVSGIAGSFSEGGEVPGSAQALNSGGKVKGWGRPSAAHFAPNVRGFAAGGRPSWVPASDTVAAWLTPGEHVMPVPSVGNYGRDFMEGIQKNRFSSAAMRAAAGLGARGGGFSAGNGAYASGGGVSSLGGSSSSAAPALAFLVADEATTERLLNAGPEALKRHFRKYAADYRAILSR